jgi:hypothetical protein
MKSQCARSSSVTYFRRIRRGKSCTDKPSIGTGLFKVSKRLMHCSHEPAFSSR